MAETAPADAAAAPAAEETKIAPSAAEGEAAPAAPTAGAEGAEGAAEGKAAEAAAADDDAAAGEGGKKRMRDTELVVPVCYGTCAYWLGKKADEYHSHKWTVYLRGPEHEDLSHAIQKVVFNLHPSFKEPVRVLEKPPYEVTETGWGEFEIGITVHFAEDAGEKPLDLFAPLKLAWIGWGVHSVHTHSHSHSHSRAHARKRAHTRAHFNRAPSTRLLSRLRQAISPFIRPAPSSA